MNAPDPIRCAAAAGAGPGMPPQDLQRLHAALDGAGTATWVWDLASGEAHVDARWTAIVGGGPAAPQRLSVRGWLDLLHPDDRAQAAGVIGRQLGGEAGPLDLQCRVRHADGSWRWVHDRGGPAGRGPDGRALWLAGTRDDITERKETELAARRDHALMQALFKLAPFGVQLINIHKGASVAVNPALMHITGYSEEALLHGDGQARFPARWQQVRAGWFRDARERGRFGPSEVEYLHADGHLLSLVFNGVRVDGDNEAFLWLCVQDVTAHRAMQAQLRQAASTDRLTGLANRSVLLADLQERLQGQADGAPLPLALLFFDFDRFKLVNDTLGHDAGDELLRAIAGRLRSHVQQLQADGSVAGATLARFGGDEFVLLLAGIGEEWQAWPVAQSLLGALAAPFNVRQQPLHSTASIGIALWRPGEPASPGDLLREADAAMYEAKRQGRGRAVVFDAVMRRRLTRASQIESVLPGALAAGQLSVAWQPIIALPTGRLLAAEALMRWSHPTLGDVPPAEFIPVAVDSGLMVELGAWMLRQACLQWRRWQQQDAALAPAVVSVNLSRIELADTARLLRTVQQALQAAAMPPQALQLEYAEHELVKDLQPTLERLRELQALGVRLALDDFGTGHASLGCLRDAPFHAVKIDHAVVAALAHEPQALAMARATVQLLGQLGLDSIADGVEQAGAAALLVAMGCRAAQGLGFAPPMGADLLLQAVAGGAGFRLAPPAADPGP